MEVREVAKCEKESKSKKEKIDNQHEELKRNILKELTILEEKKKNAAGGWNRPTLSEQLWEIELARRERVKQEERMTKIYQQEEQQRLEPEKWKCEIQLKKKERNRQGKKEECNEMVVIDYKEIDKEKSFRTKDKIIKRKESVMNRICEEQPEIRYNTHRGFKAEEQELVETTKEREKELQEQRKVLEQLRDLDKKKKIERQKTFKEKWKEKERLRGIEEKRKEDERMRVCEEKRKEAEKNRRFEKERKEKERKRALEERMKDEEKLRELEQKQMEEKRLRALGTKKKKETKRAVLGKRSEEEKRKLEEKFKKEKKKIELKETVNEEERQRKLEKQWKKDERKREIEGKKNEQRRRQDEEEMNSIITFSEKEKRQNKRKQQTQDMNWSIKEEEAVEEELINRIWEERCQFSRGRNSSYTPEDNIDEHLNPSKEPKSLGEELQRKMEDTLQRYMTETEESEDENEKDMKLKSAFGHIGKVMKKTYQKVIDFTKNSSNNFEESRRQHVTRHLHFTLQELEEAKVQLMIERQNISMTQDQQHGSTVFFNAL